MPDGHGVDNCSLRFCRNGRELDLGESRSPTQIIQWNLLLAFHRLWAYVYAIGADGDHGEGMMVMMMVSVMVIIVPEAIRHYSHIFSLWVEVKATLPTGKSEHLK
jgi:hypothetical protein